MFLIFMRLSLVRRVKEASLHYFTVEFKVFRGVVFKVFKA